MIQMRAVPFALALIAIPISLAVLARFASSAQSRRIFVSRIALDVAFIFCLAITATLLWGPEATLVLFLVSITIAGPSLLVGLLLAVIGKVTAGKAHLLLAGLLMIASASSETFSTIENATAKSFCESLIDDIENYRSAYGAYPETLDEIRADLGIRPLRAIVFSATVACGYYRVKGDAFVFVVRRSIWNDWVYLSKRGYWTTND